jgi:hypothetical protein
MTMILFTDCCEAQKLKNVPKWSVHEFTLKASGNYDNPYTQVNVTATFTGPDNVSKTVQGFWNEDKYFTIRFTPTVTWP